MSFRSPLSHLTQEPSKSASSNEKADPQRFGPEMKAYEGNIRSLLTVTQRVLRSKDYDPEKERLFYNEFQTYMQEILQQLGKLAEKGAFLEVEYLLTVFDPSTAISFHQMMIVNHPVQKDYLQFLKKLQQRGFPAEKLYSLLQTLDLFNWHLGMSILADLAKSLPAANVISLLKLQTKEGWHLGTFIARHQGKPSIQDYLSLLGDLAKCPLAAANIFSLVKLQTQDGWHLGGLIARHQDATSTLSYLTFLQLLPVPAADVLPLFKSTNSQDEHLGLYIAHYQDAACTQIYITCLQVMIQKGVPCAEVLSLFTAKNDDLRLKHIRLRTFFNFSMR